MSAPMALGNGITSRSAKNRVNIRSPLMGTISAHAAWSMAPIWDSLKPACQSSQSRPAIAMKTVWLNFNLPMMQSLDKKLKLNKTTVSPHVALDIMSMLAERSIRLKVNKPSKVSLKYDTRKCHLQPEQAKATKALAKRKKSCNEDWAALIIACIVIKAFALTKLQRFSGQNKVGRTAGLS